MRFSYTKTLEKKNADQLEQIQSITKEKEKMNADQMEQIQTLTKEKASLFEKYKTCEKLLNGSDKDYYDYVERRNKKLKFKKNKS